MLDLLPSQSSNQDNDKHVLKNRIPLDHGVADNKTGEVGKVPS